LIDRCSLASVDTLLKSQQNVVSQSHNVFYGTKYYMSLLSVLWQTSSTYHKSIIDDALQFMNFSHFVRAERSAAAFGHAFAAYPPDRFEIGTDATRLIRNMRWMCARRRGSFELWISKPRIPDVLNVLVLERADRVN
jgi:hypothetical protein